MQVISTLPETRSGTVGAAQTLPRSRLLAVCAVACLSLLLANVFWRQSYTGDEGFYGVTALNILHSPSYWLRPSYYPDGSFPEDRDGFAHPPLNSYLYALSLSLSAGSLAGPELVDFFAFVLLLYFSYRVVELYDRRAAICAVLLLAASPTIAALYSPLEAEPLMVTSGIVGLYCILRAPGEPRPRRWHFIGGLCLGLAFEFKLWLCGPLVLAAIAAALLGIRPTKSGVRSAVVRLGLIGLGAGIPAALHLAAIAVVYPQDLPFWLRNIYLGFFTSSGIDGSKFGGTGVRADWVHPFWYYPAILYRDHFFLAPIILFGLDPLLRDRRFRSSIGLALLAGICGLLPLSAMKVKESLYILSCTIFIYFLAGCCLAALARTAAWGKAATARWRGVVCAILCAALPVFPVAYALGIQREKITGLFVIAHSAVLILYLALWRMAERKPHRQLESVFTALASVVIALNLALHVAGNVPREKAVARLMGPRLLGDPPGQLSFIASNFKAYQFRWFRRGCYWTELPLSRPPEAVLYQARFAHVKVFILDDEDLRRPEIVPWLQWLETHATEMTGELNARLGCTSGYRIFARETRPNLGLSLAWDASQPRSVQSRPISALRLGVYEQ